MEQIRIEYDDDADTIIAKVNAVLRRLGVGIAFEDDEQSHDGFNVYYIVHEAGD